ncbi:MAG: hypothetical protein U0S12_14070 [Fimbriimonadales bacterium]
MATRIVTAVLAYSGRACCGVSHGGRSLAAGILRWWPSCLPSSRQSRSFQVGWRLVQSLWIDVILLFAAAPIVVNYGAKGMSSSSAYS